MKLNAPWSLDTEILTHRRKFVKLQYVSRIPQRRIALIVGFPYAGSCHKVNCTNGKKRKPRLSKHSVHSSPFHHILIDLIDLIILAERRQPCSRLHECIRVRVQVRVRGLFGSSKWRKAFLSFAEHHGNQSAPVGYQVTTRCTGLGHTVDCFNIKARPQQVRLVKDEFRMVLGGQPTPFFFLQENLRKAICPCRSSTITRSCETHPMGWKGNKV